MAGPIKINTCDYCERCPDFSPTVSRHYCLGNLRSQTVVCKNRELCARIYKLAIGDMIRKGAFAINDT